MSSHPFRRACRPAATAGLVLLMLAGRCAFAQPPAVSQSATASSGAPTISQDIRDIRGPKPIHSIALIPLILMGGLLAAGGAYATWEWNRRRRRTTVKTPLEFALDRLEKACVLMMSDRGRDFSIEVSSAVREYIESRFQVMAAHRTTIEFLRDLVASSDPVLAAHRSLLTDFLQSCDLAKFGGWNLANQAMEIMLQSARRFVTESAPSVMPKELKTPPPPVSTREVYDSLPST
jgi:type IV secretory pathway VirB2 component (pilin)